MMQTYFCSKCEVYALGMNIEPYDAICLCGNRMDILEEE
jgi:hypothetical protein